MDDSLDTAGDAADDAAANAGPQPSDPFAAPPEPPTLPTLPAPPAAGPAAGVPGGVFAAPPSLATTEIQVAPEAPTKKRRVGLLVGVAVLAVIGAVVGVVLATKDDGGATYSLAEASTSAADAEKVAFEMHMSAAEVEMTMNARVDTTEQLMAISADMPALLEGGAVEMIMDLDAKVMYMDASALPGAAEGAPTKWISMDLSKVPGAEEQFGSLTGSPLDAAKLFEGAKEVKEVGIEEVDGISAKHYVVTVSLADALAAQPNIFDQLGDAADQLPETIDYDVWITEDNQLHKMSFSLEVAGETLEVEMTITAVGDIEPIVLPADDEVTDMTDLLGG